MGAMLGSSNKAVLGQEGGRMTAPHSRGSYFSFTGPSYQLLLRSQKNINMVRLQWAFIIYCPFTCCTSGNHQWHYCLARGVLCGFGWFS